MGIGKKDYSIRMELPVHEDFDENPKSTVSFQPTITLVEQASVEGVSPPNLIYKLEHGKTVLVATENLTVKGPQILRDLSGLSEDIRTQAAEHFKGRVIDPRRFKLDDFVWAMELLNRTYEYSKFPAEHLEVWRKCFGLVGDLRLEQRMFKYTSFVGPAPDFPDVQIAIHPVYATDPHIRDLGPRFADRDARISGFTIYAAFELANAWHGKENNIKAAIEKFIETELAKGRLALKKAEGFPSEYFLIGIPEGPEDKDRNIYVSWSNWADVFVSQEAKETLPELYERGVPKQVAYLGQVVKSFLTEKDRREIEQFAEAMENRAMGIDLAKANAPKGFVPKEFGHGWVGPVPPPKGLEDDAGASEEE